MGDGNLTQAQQSASDATNGRVLQPMGACCDQWMTRTQTLGGLWYSSTLN